MGWSRIGTPCSSCLHMDGNKGSDLIRGGDVGPGCRLSSDTGARKKWFCVGPARGALATEDPRGPLLFESCRIIERERSPMLITADQHPRIHRAAVRSGFFALHSQNGKLSVINFSFRQCEQILTNSLRSRTGSVVHAGCGRTRYVSSLRTTPLPHIHVDSPRAAVGSMNSATRVGNGRGARRFTPDGKCMGTM